MDIPIKIIGKNYCQFKDESEYDSRLSLEKTSLTVSISKSMQKRLNLESFTVDLVGTPGLRLRTLDRNPSILQIHFKKDEQMPVRDDVLVDLREDRGYSLVGKTLGDSIWDDFIDVNSSANDPVLAAVDKQPLLTQVNQVTDTKPKHGQNAGILDNFFLNSSQKDSVQHVDQGLGSSGGVDSKGSKIWSSHEWNLKRPSDSHNF